jgi:hypothetical protein
MQFNLTFEQKLQVGAVLIIGLAGVLNYFI